jgi:hypothetical protein
MKQSNMAFEKNQNIDTRNCRQPAQGVRILVEKPPTQRTMKNPGVQKIVVQIAKM